MKADAIENKLLQQARAAEPVIDASALFDDLDAFLSRFISYPSEHARTAHALWIAHAWLMEHWDSTPRIAFLSPEPGSGKSRALEVTEPLVPRAVHAVNTTPAYLFRKVSDPAGPPTILYDEIDTVFGPRAKDNEEIRGMLNAGHRRGATAGRCVVRGKLVEIEELPAYCAVALAGLDDLPDTLGARSIIIRMKRRSAGETIQAWRQRTGGAEAKPIAERLELWATRIKTVDWPEMPLGVEDRNADLWEALLAVADLAGGGWPEKARVAAVALVTASLDDKRSLGIQLLSDLRGLFNERDRLATDEIVHGLTALPESPWTDLRGKPIDARGLSTRLRKYGIKPRQFRFGEKVVRGYERADFLDPWSRYLPSPLLSESPVTAATSATSEDREERLAIRLEGCGLPM